MGDLSANKGSLINGTLSLLISWEKHSGMQMLHPRINITTGQILSDHIEPGIRDQNFRYTNTFRGLIIFQDSGYDPRKRKSTSIERMQQLGFAVFVFVPQLQPVGLEGFKVTYRT